jgi:flagellar protein FliO/FliZ
MDTVTLIGRLLVSLAAVLGLMWVIARRMKRSGGRGRRSQLIDVLSRQQLSRNASVAVVRVGEQALVLGVTDAQVSVLGQTDLAAAQALVPSNAEVPRSRRSRTVGPDGAAAARPAAGPRAGAGVAAGGAAGVTAAQPDASAKAAALSGSALSPQTWKQTLDTLRDLTARQS